MKKLFLGLALALGISTTAQAAWYATAVSTTAYGYAVASNRADAMNRALYECNIRTAAGSPCHITEVYWQ